MRSALFFVLGFVAAFAVSGIAVAGLAVAGKRALDDLPESGSHTSDGQIVYAWRIRRSEGEERGPWVVEWGQGSSPMGSIGFAPTKPEARVILETKIAEQASGGSTP